MSLRFYEKKKKSSQYPKSKQQILMMYCLRKSLTNLPTFLAIFFFFIINVKFTETAQCVLRLAQYTTSFVGIWLLWHFAPLSVLLM